ncbi:hypothetical protein NHQ30_005799 [Ciborinia camelliae]|nr:hypothetical protein NHQ30_005799 [Ciborinia camelliae]
MVKFTSIALFLIAAVSVHACTYCQCLFNNGGHCCVYHDPNVGNVDCTEKCKTARRHDSSVTDLPGGGHAYGTLCAAAGRYKCATIFQADHRALCRLLFQPFGANQIVAVIKTWIRHEARIRAAARVRAGAKVGAGARKEAIQTATLSEWFLFIAYYNTIPMPQILNSFTP